MILPLPISAVLIAEHCANTIAPTLKSITFIEDIIVLLTDVQDPTAEVATQFGARVAYQSWLGFGQQKNHAACLAQYSWILSIDSDEVLSDALRASIENIFSTLPASTSPENKSPSPIAYQMRRLNHFLGRPLYFGEGGHDHVIRLYHREYAHWSDDIVHERLILDDSHCPVDTLAGPLHHYSARSLEHYLEKQNQYSSLLASQWRSKGIRPNPFNILINPCIRFIRFYFFKQGFRDGWAGFAHIVIGCYATFMKYLKLMQDESKTES